MKRESSGLWLIAALVFGGALFPQIARRGGTIQSGAASGHGSSASDRSHGDSENEPCYDGAGKLLAQFDQYFEALVKPPNSESGAPDRDDAALTARTDATQPPPKPKHEVSFLIATVADPVDSHLANLFDPFLEAIQGAFEDCGFVLDRFSLPWDCAREGARLNSGRFANRIFAREPGVMLFRSTGATSPPKSPPESDREKLQLWVVFLVGETPTSGIQKESLASALNFIRKYHEWRKEPWKEQKIVGPTFSGSALSLRTGLENWWPEPKDQTGKRPSKVRIISGSALAFQTKATLTDKSAHRPDMDVSYMATVHPSKRLERDLYDYLGELGAKTEEVAVLRESTTVFGQAVKTKLREVDPARSRDARPAVGPGWDIVYPMHISRVRAAYEDSDSAQASGEPARASRGAPRGMPSVGTHGGERDVVPAESPEMTTASVDLALRNILSTIARAGIRYVGLYGSDFEDLIFLARQIRLHCPDVRLFTFNAHILYCLPKNRPFLDGTLVVSTYPLLVENQIWTRRGGGDDAIKQIRQFPMTFSSGVYNAVVALVNYAEDGTPNDPTHKKPLLQYRPPQFQARFSTDKAAPAIDVGRPPVWLTVVGQDGLWPVRAIPVIGEKDTKQDLQNQDTKQGSQEWKNYVFQVQTVPDELQPAKEIFASGFSLFLFYCFSVFCIANSVWYYYAANAGGPRYFNVSKTANVPRALSFAVGRWQLEIFRPTRTPATWRRQWFWLLCYMVVGLLSYLFFASFAVIPWLANLNRSLPYFQCSTCVFVLTCQVAALLDLLLRWRQDASRRPQLGLIRIAGISFAVAILLAILLCRSVLHTGEQAVFMYMRSVNITSGLSVVVPALLLAFGLVAGIVCHLRRLWLLDTNWNGENSTARYPERGVRTPLSSGTGRGAAGIPEMDDDVVRALSHPLFSGRPGLASIVYLLFGLFPLVTLFLWYLPPHELWFLDWALRLAFAFLFMMILGACIQVASVWHRFRWLLRRLAWHPMVDAYDRLPAKFGTTIGGQFYGRLATVTELELLADWTRELTADGYAEVTQEWKDTAREVQEKWAKQTRSTRRIVFWRSECWQRISAFSKLLVASLEKRWNSLPIRPSTRKALRSEDRKASAASHAEHGVAASIREELWWLRAEELIAAQVATHARWVFAQLGNLLTFVMAGALTLLLAVTTYPFEPRGLLRIFVSFGLLGAVLLAITVFVQANRSDVLSRIAGTTPESVTWDFRFVGTLFAYGALPIMGLITVMFPGLGDALFPWVDTIVRVFK